MTFVNKKLLRNLDWWLVFSVMILSVFGIVAIASATRTSEGVFFTSLVRRQMMWVVFSWSVAALTIFVDYRLLSKFAYILYGSSIAMLILVLFVGETIKGAQRWVIIGPASFQPSEFAKILIIIGLAHFLEKKPRLDKLYHLIIPTLFIAIPAALIAQQPDLGTALVLVFMLFAMLFAAGLRLRHMAYVVGLGGFVALPIAWVFALKPYQKERLLVFLDPQRDPLGAGYNVIQSRIAIGSGRMAGHGLFAESTQSGLNFIPEQYTDFIFAVIGEGLGFWGSVLLLLLFAFILVRCMRIAMRSKDQFGSLVVVGLTSMLAFHVLVNAGMTLGLMPVTGLPLPFVSYGGSSYLTNAIVIGIILNIGMRYKKIQF